MMEGMHQDETGQEEYILGMRNYQTDSEEWKHRRSEPLKPGGTTNYNTRRRTKALIPMTEDHATKVLASLVPDEIIYNDNDYSNRYYEVCLLFGDVSGFTDLCEMYNKTGKGGPSRLTTVLNSYIGAMVQEILSHNGDVLKFSGDAFLAMWKCENAASLQDVVHYALDSAIMIQKSYGTYETDVGVVLRVKLAVSAGNAVFSIIGDSKISHYVLVGQPIFDVKAAEKKASAGEIIISSSAWHYVSSNEYVFEPINDGIHIKVKGIGASWRPSQKNVDKIQRDVGVESSSSRLSCDSSEMGLMMNEDDKPLREDDFSLRPTVNYASEKNLKSSLRKFIIPPIMRGIDLDEPIEYLTEMRQIVIVFINVVVIPKLEIEKYIILIDTAYKKVCHVVTEMQGCVNKVSLFDKDLMFVILFGLRGYKSELESQTGLRCAFECYQAINSLNYVISTSVAVTTGVTYCGVVGHTLRREYTVISLTVNKAARLMCAYPNKVTCDRETFLHSKLESRNFILQEAKPLKGITNVGPVYEFKENQDVTDDKAAINPFPLLGRSEEMRLYCRLLEDCIEINKEKAKVHALQVLNHHTMLLVNGDPRIGKTRLLDEFIYTTPSAVPVNRFTLTKRDYKTPFFTLQRIFAMPLGLSALSTTEERESKLKNRLQKIKIPDFLSALNKVFNVNFEKTPLYLSLTTEQKQIALQKILKQLCYVGFVTLWVIAIDDAQFIDEESWPYFQTLLDSDVVFIVMTMDTSKKVCASAATILKNRRVRVIELEPIDKWYHAGLACQILDVHAIPPELEKLIQTRSNGNPGWIESFLVSLVQAGGLLIQHLSKPDINEYGLVSPPVDMMIRLSSEEARELEKTSSHAQMKRDSDGMGYSKQDGWKMFKFSYRDSVIHVMKEKIMEKRLKYGNLIPVCVIAPTFKLEEVDPELSMDVMIIKLFDSLTSYEQLLLKCSSVLGEYFPRDMLLYIMVANKLRVTALAVQKLFELRVLACAQGDFLQGDIGMIFSQRLYNPNHDVGIRCDCRGLKIHESCLDLPKYASCGYLRFRLPMFRDTTYNLLTDNQKKEFHNRAIRYLEKETRRCRSCGNGFFVRILGTRNDDGFVRKQKRSTTESGLSSRNRSMQRSSSRFSDLGVLSSSELQTFNYGKASVSSSRRDTMGLALTESAGAMNSAKYSTDYYLPRYCMGYGLINKLKYSISLTKTFSYADFSSCQCPQILNTMYTQMLEHCKGAGQKDKMLDALLEYAYICILSCNIPQAIKILEEACIVIEQHAVFKDEEEEQEIQWKIPLLRGKVETLYGHARLELGQLEEAYICLHQALNYYGYKFPRGVMNLQFKNFKYSFKHHLSMFLFPTLFVATVNGYEAEFCDNVSECLSLLYRLYKEVQMWDYAQLAAGWSLSKSLESDTDFFGLCSSYSNMLDVCHHLGKNHMCVAIEVHALRLCHRKKTSVEAQELKAVALLYSAILRSRLMRSELERSIHIGAVMIKICATIHAIQISLQVLPLLVQAMLMRHKISDAVSTIMELEYCSEEDTDNSGRTWFYAACIVLQLETGYTLMPYKKCENFYQVEGDTLITIRDPDAERRFYTVMWLWCARNEEWEAATVWYAKACEFVEPRTGDSLNNMYTALYLLEGLLLFVVGKIDRRNVAGTAKAYDEIKGLIRSIERSCQNIVIILPRFYHLKAYFKFIRNEESKAFTLLYKAKALAEAHENLLEVAWIEHSEKAWSNNLPATAIDFWKEHCEPDNLLDYHEAELNDDKLGFFTLPVPMYY